MRYNALRTFSLHESVAAKLRNPLAVLSEEQILADVDAWCIGKGLFEHRDMFQEGALIARMWQRNDGFEYVGQLSTKEKGMLRHEATHRWWSQPFQLHFMVILCAGSAII